MTLSQEVLRICPILSVRDMTMAIREYESFGFQCEQTFGHPPIHAILKLGPQTIYLSANGNAGQQAIWIEVHHLTQAYNHIKLLQPSLAPPSSQSWGYLEFSFCDMSGNQLTFAQRH